VLIIALFSHLKLTCVYGHAWWFVYYCLHGTILLTSDMAVNDILDFDSNIPSLENRLSVRNDICIDGCNSKEKNFIRCCLCTKWYHIACLSLPQNELNGVWACLRCRYVAEEVSEMRSLTRILIQDNIEMKDMLKKQQEQIDCFIALQTTTSGFLKDIEGYVKEIRREVSEETDSESEDEFDDYDDPEGHICYNNSLTLDCIPTKEDMTFEKAGPYINNITKAIRKLPARKVKKEIILVIGTNDVASRRPVDKIAHDCELLVKEATLRRDKVTLSSIPPRMDNKVDSEKMDTVNEIYHQIADKNDGVTFVDHDNNFKYRDGSIDKSMLLEGDWLHLSSKGTQKIINNLSLDAKPTIGVGPTNKWINNESRVTAQRHKGKYPPLATAKPSYDTTPWSPSWKLHQASSMFSPWQDTQPNPAHVDITQRNRRWPGVRNLPHTKGRRYFQGDRDPLSNFYMVQFQMWGKVFKSLEHAYQWRKAVFLDLDHVAWEIMEASTARDAKRIADQKLNTHGSDWNIFKKDCMYDLLLAKMDQCPQMKTSLLESGHEQIIEDTNHEYWARGSKGQGLNMLGTLLMIIRDGLYSDFQQSQTTSECYRAPQNGFEHPCYQCGEGNHNRETCRHQGTLQCTQCNFTGHKRKHCPDLS